MRIVCIPFKKGFNQPSSAVRNKKSFIIALSTKTVSFFEIKKRLIASSVKQSKYKMFRIKMAAFDRS